MPMVLAILCGILLGLLLLFKGFSLKGLTIVLMPLYFAVRNLVQQKRVDGDWIMCWPKFWQAIILELMIIGIPASVGLISEPEPSISMLLGITLYIILTAVAYSIAKETKSEPVVER